MNRLLEVEHLNVSFYTYAGVVQAVRDVSFSLDKNKTVAIVGESGCGKSVTAKAIMGLIEKPGKIEAGSKILFDGEPLEAEDEKAWQEYRGKKASIIFQDALVALNPTMKIGKQIVESLENHTDLSKEEQRKLAIDMLTGVGIADAARCMEQYPHELSGGMRQRVMIASALITKPQLLIADEPTTALDVTIQAQILRLIKSVQKDLQMSIILITHDLGVVADFAEEIIVMYAGKIIEKGSCRDIFYKPKHPYTWALLNAVPKLSIEKEKRLETIPGTVPDMTHPPVGCAFCGRCPYARKLCQKMQPPEYQVGEDHFVSCWLQDSAVDSSNIDFLNREEE